MSFSVPKEYSDFVTNAEDLLDQFNSGSSALETVSYSIHVQNCSPMKAMEVLSRASEALDHLLRGYLWHNEPFRLVIKADPGEPLSLFGTTCIGECIEDEWFIVYLLIKLSQDIQDIAISVVDTDGQFLLMEAADYIDDWVGPENADNRVWIKSGAFHIIPLDEPGRLKTGGMRLDAAIKSLLGEGSNQRNFKANEGFHRTIYQRTLHAFPARAQANRHSALCIVPGWLAELISANPLVVARAVVEFHNADKDQLRQACATSAAGKGMGSGSAASDQRLVLLPVQFTRALYAQLTFKNFHPPRKYHAMMRRVAEASSRKVSQAFDRGCRLACGVDCAYFNSRETLCSIGNSSGPAVGSNPAWVELLGLTRASGPVDERQLEKLFEEGSITSTANFERRRSGDTVFPRGFRTFVHEVSREKSSMGGLDSELDQEAADREVFRSIVDGAVVGDADDWLYMTPDALDKEMQTRVDRFAAAAGTAPATTPAQRAHAAPLDGLTPASATVTAITGVADVNALSGHNVPSEKTEDEASAAALQSMLDGFKTFMEGSSDVDGISFAPSAAVSREPPSSSLGDKPAPDSTGSLQLDYDLLDSLLQGGTLPPSTPLLVAASVEEGAEEQARTAAGKERADLAGYFSKEDLRQLDSDGEDSDSEDEDEDDRQGAHAADQYLENIFKSSASNKSAPAGHAGPSSPAEAGTAQAADSALLGVGGGYLQPSPTRRRGASVDVDSDDEVEEATHSGGASGMQGWGSGVVGDEEDLDEDGDDDQDELDEDLIREYQVCAAIFVVALRIPF